MTRFRAVIADDEPLARRGLRARLADYSEFIVTGEAQNGREAIALVRNERPDVLFLDIQMPGLDGFDVLHELGNDVPPNVVFVTAFDEYAIEAFRVRALDYLLKPVEPVRFHETIQRILSRPAAVRNETVDAVRSLLRKTRLAIRADDKTVLLPLDDILHVRAEADYVRIHTSRGTYLHRATMKAIEQQLDERFLRVHRSAIVRLDVVREVHPLLGGESLLVLNDGTRIRTGRSYRQALRQAFAAV